MKTAISLFLALAAAGGVSGAPEVREVCSADVCMPMRCDGAACTPLPPMTKPLMQWSDLLSRPRPRPTETIAYASRPEQVIDLWRPDTHTPAPVVVMIHGGCWQASVADRTLMDWAAADLARRGVAVWNIEYRGIDQPGGGYPGTYEDVAAATDKLAAEAVSRGLQPGPFVVLGHSAGGHLALWTAARRRLPRSSPLWRAHPMPVRAVIDVAGIANLETDLNTTCGPAPVHVMTGAATLERPDVYADTSPAHLLPLGTPVWVVHGRDDHTVPTAVGEAYADLARKRGDQVQVLNPPGGHTEEIAPGSKAWEEIAKLVLRLTGS